MALPSDFAYYEIYRSDNNEAFVLVGTSTTNDFNDTSAEIGHTYCYQIVTVDIFGNRSSPSSDTCVFFSTQGATGDNQQTIANPTAILSKDNIICVYRQDDSESLSLALRYQELHDLDDDQLVSIPCSNIEVLTDYIAFQAEVEDPLRQKITSAPVRNRSVYGIVLMPYVPGGFRDGSDVISTTSRLARIFYPFEKNIQNPIYNRQVFQRFNGYDAIQSLICTRIDGPSIVTSVWFDNIEAAKSRLETTGKFYFDPYASYTYSGASEYTDELIDFKDNYSSRLGLTIQGTSRPPAGRDAFFSQIEDDSFFWGWGADRGSLSYFRTTANTRAFFYNADFDGGLTIRDLDARSWPILAIREGYVAAAGSMSGVDTSSFLRPVPFMDTLFRGASLGEAFVYSQPLLNSSMACFGDLLAVFAFPVPFEESQLIDPVKAWKMMETCYAESVCYLFRKSNIIKDLRDTIVSGSDEVVQEELDYAFDALYSEFDDLSWKNDFVNLTTKFIDFVVDRNATRFDFAYPNFNQYLTATSTKVSDIVLDTLQNETLVSSIVSSNIETEGSWIFEDYLEQNPGDFRFYHIELQVARNYEDFEGIGPILSKDTFSDITNWSFEDYNGDFRPFNGNGITSNYEGRKVRYTSLNTELLERGEFYWFRIRQKDDLQEFAWRYFRRIVFR